MTRVARTLAESYLRFAAAAAASSPLYERVAAAIGRSDAALRAIAATPARKRRPAVVLAALHDLALAGQAPALAAAYAERDGDAAAVAAVETLLERADAVVSIAARRQVRDDETGHHAVLYPAIAEAARRAAASAVGLIDVGRAAGLNLVVDRVGITYRDGLSLGDLSSPVRKSCALVGAGRVPTVPMPEVVARVTLDGDPLDVADADDARWLRACVWPDQTDRAARLEAEIALAARDRRVRVRGDVVGDLSAAVGCVPAEALPVVITTWTLRELPRDRRPGFLERLEAAAADRPVAWVAVEGVGVAPEVPTLGDRPASGHSIVGLTVLDPSTRRAEALGRCWSRGRMLSWLATP